MAAACRYAGTEGGKLAPPEESDSLGGHSPRNYASWTHTGKQDHNTAISSHFILRTCILLMASFV
eukprot:13565870-Alexandrium_andersonii.AAC.1